MGLIPEETIQEVLAATDIVELIEGYFPLKRRGQDFWALCPFHAERSASFKVSPSRQAFHCFGCGASGHAIRFVMDYENLDFPSAVKRLAARSGIVIREEESSPEERARSHLRSQLMALHKEAALWFHEQLLRRRKPDADRAREYLKQRGISGEIAKRWLIGYAPAEGKALADWARERGYSGKLMLASGMMARQDEDVPSRGLYARFRDRVMFPINNDFGETVAFSGRLLDREARTAKYVNSPETILFNKSKIFFGLDKSKRAIARAESVIVCEGQLDMLRCFESGVENVVAPLGTAFTEHHARTLRRFAGDRGEALLCFDSDNAGYKAAKRAYAELASAGLFVRAVELPTGEDPDSLITGRGAEAFRERVDAARPFYHFQIERLSSSLDINDPRDRVEFANEIARSLSSIADPVAREAMVSEVATRLSVSADDFRKRVADAARENEKEDRRKARRDESEPPAGSGPPPVELRDPDARILLRLALSNEEVLNWMVEERAEALQQLSSCSGVGLLTEIWKQPPSSSEPLAVNAYLASMDEAKSATLNHLLHTPSAARGLPDAQRALLRIRIRNLEEERAATVTQLRNPKLEKSQIFALTSKSETQRKELLDLKISLKNIAEPRA